MTATPTVMSAADCFQEFADHLPQPAWIADRAGSIFWCNRRWQEYTGVASRGWDWLQLIQPDHAAQVETQVRNAVATGEEWEATFPLRAIDGAYRWFMTRAVPVLDDTGAIVRWYATTTDVSERVRREDDLLDAARRQDAVLAWLGHELRNPLAPILTSAHLLTMIGPANPDLQKATDTIVRQTRQLSNLIENLLDAGRLSFGKLRLRRTQVELTPLVAQAVEGCRHEIDRRQHRLQITLSPEPVILDADATRIVQMISNLLTNAAKYMADGGVIQLSSHCEGASVVVRVRDQGIGIAADVLSRVFEPYVQVGAGPMHTQGLGIGLALVKSIAEGHGGTAEALSDGVNQGSEFIIRLPVNTSSHIAGALP
jgi:PAS domain S-box-containing protein